MSITPSPPRHLDPVAGPLSDEVRLAFRQVAGTVSIVTALAADGSRQGATVTSLASVSLKPPSLLVVLNGAARTHAAILATRFFAVNILGDSQGGIAALFADPTRHLQRFASAAWQASDHGVPVLDGALATFVCTVADSRPFGTHTVFIGTVDRALRGAVEAPLLYHDGGYHRLGGDI